MATFRNESNYLNHPIIQTPPFSRKNYIPSIPTPTFEIIIPISEHLHLTELKWGYQTSTSLRQSLRTSNWVAKCVLAFNSVCKTQTEVSLTYPDSGESLAT